MIFVDAINVNNNKMVFSADDYVLVKLLKQQQAYGVKKFIAEFPSNLQSADTVRINQMAA